MSEQMVDRPLRSVFVGNIPYEVTEEKLKEIFSEVGPVLSLKLVYDRETGKPKGYGFCEYKDVETAMSAMRNLNGYEINGRVLRVDNAGAERHRMAEMGTGGGMNQQHNGPRHDNNNEAAGAFMNIRDEGPPAPEKAPEVISKAVASLPPEQMFEIMKQMKLCIQNNPGEARNMLLQNPQLAYALLQALVVMKIVDPPTAISMLHKDNSMGMGSLLPEGQSMNMMSGGSGGFGGGPPTENPWIAAAAGPGTGIPLMPPNPPGPFGPGSGVGGKPGPGQGNLGGDMDLRQMDPRLRGQGGGGGGGPPQDFDLRDPRAQSERFNMEQRRDRDLRDMRDRDMRGDRDLRNNDRDLRDPRADRDLRAPLDPRAARGGGGRGGPGGQSGPSESSTSAAQSAASNAAAAAFSGMAGLGPGATDKEKASLIMQVLQLSDEQINLLPEAQRQSILVLKEQIAKSTSQR